MAEEVVHEAFVCVWQRRHAVEGATLKGLLYKTTQNLALNERRKARLRESVPLLGWLVGDSPAQDIEKSFLARERLGLVQAALEKLPLELRETLLMCQFSEMSYAEIGSALGIPPGTVGSRRTRALAELKRALDKEFDHDIAL